MKWTNPAHEYDAIVEKLLNAETTYRLWGAAQLGIEFCTRFSDELNVVQIVDGDCKKHGKHLANIEVEAPDKLVYDEKSVVVVTCSYYEENRPIIEKIGYKTFYKIPNINIILNIKSSITLLLNFFG